MNYGEVVTCQLMQASGWGDWRSDGKPPKEMTVGEMLAENAKHRQLQIQWYWKPVSKTYETAPLRR